MKILGQSVDGDGLCILYEHMAGGDLNRALVCTHNLYSFIHCGTFSFFHVIEKSESNFTCSSSKSSYGRR